MISAPPFARRALALVILLLPFTMIWLLAIEPLITRHGETQDAMDRTLHLLARYKANATQKADLEQMVMQRRQLMPQQQGVIDAANVALASSALQSSLRRILETNGGSVRVLSIAPPVREQGYDRLTARAEIGIASDRLIEVIYALESVVAPNLTIEALDIRAPDQPQKADENVSLMVRLDVSGYWEPK